MNHDFGSTTNFQIATTDDFWKKLSVTEQNNVTANATYLLGKVEDAFNTTTGWFGTDVSNFGTSHRQQVLLDWPNDSGAHNDGYNHPIEVDPQKDNNTSTAGPIVSMLWMNEWSEVLMSLTHSTNKWNAGDSSGEGLSHYCGLQLFLDGHNDYYHEGNNKIFVQSWLDGNCTTDPNNIITPNPARSDWVNNTFTKTTVNGTVVNGDGDPVSYGCAICFIYYLTVQLGFSINEVIANYSNYLASNRLNNLASCYHAVTGDPSDPFPGFIGILNNIYPVGQNAILSTDPIPVGTNPNNPFPIAQVQFISGKNTFGKDEMQDIIDSKKPVLLAFWVVIDGLSQQAFQNLGVQVVFTGSFANLKGAVAITPNLTLGIEFQNGVNPKSPQVIRIPYDITFSKPILAQFPGSGASATLDLSTYLTAGSSSTKVTGLYQTMEFELIAAGDPYFTNVDQTSNLWYLSQDLRVFSATAYDGAPFPGGPVFNNDSVKGAYGYIQALLSHMNSTAVFTNPAIGTDPFSLLPGQQGEGQTDSSTAPFVQPNLPSSYPVLNNYNFAIARVRLRGSGAASDVRVFFRVFASQTPDTDYNPSSTYVSQQDAANEPGSPMPGVGQNSLPFFATGNLEAQYDYQPGGPNIQTLTIPQGNNSLWWYFGCFLNFYDPNNKVANKQVQTWLPGTHHCLVAQIAYDDAPIPNGASPMTWDQLAQRNLQFTEVDNPGPAATHRAPQTFDIRPSEAGLQPDQLMIDWGNVPRGSTATIYWPAVAAADVIALARATGLSSSDAHTLTQKIEGGVSYIPIPEGTGQNFAGLFTLELPAGIRTGQEFEVLVRRIGTQFGNPPEPPPSIVRTAARLQRAQKPALVEVESPNQWRYVIGTFVVRIPVTTGKSMLIPEAITLAIMKWRLANLPPDNRWAPVLERYIKYCSARLDGVGGDSSQVPPSLTWVPPLPGKGRNGRPRGRELCGRVTEVLFDCCGELEGFVLDDCCERHLVKSCEQNIADLVLRACREKFTVYVTLCPDTSRIRNMAIGLRRHA